MIIPGVFLFFFGSGILKGYFAAYVLIGEKHFEYCDGKNILKTATKDISSVKLKSSRYESFIEVHSHGAKCIKIPAHYWRQGLLLGMLTSHKDANKTG